MLCIVGQPICWTLRCENRNIALTFFELPRELILKFTVGNCCIKNFINDFTVYRNNYVPNYILLKSKFVNFGDYYLANSDFQNFITQVDACINSRILGSTLSDTKDLTTSCHLLSGTCVIVMM